VAQTILSSVPGEAGEPELVVLAIVPGEFAVIHLPSDFNNSAQGGEMKRALILLAFTTLQMSAQVLPPTKFGALPPGFRQSLIGTFSQTCIIVTPPVGTCSTVSGNPAIENGASGGNQYDRQGNLYFSFENAIMRMTPEGAFTKFADTPVTLTCTQPTATTAMFTSTSIGSGSFNVAANSLYVVTGNTVTKYSSAAGSCNPDGTFTGTLSNGVLDSTTALIRVQGFKLSVASDE
jgi:hypothetical protein